MLPTLNTKNLEEPYTRWFIYGDTRSGKTSAAATFPRPLILVPQNENSVTTLAGRKFDYLIVKDRSSPFNEKVGMGGMDAILKRIETEYHKDPNAFPYDTIVCDALTHYAELVQDEMTQGAKVAMDVQKYNLVTAHFRNIHARLTNMQVNVVYCALSKIDEKSDKGDAYLSKKVAEILPSSCEVYAHMTVKDQGRDKDGKDLPRIYTMHTRTHGVWKAGTRFHRLPPTIQNFDYNKIKHLLTNLSVDEIAEVEAERQAEQSSEQAS